MESIETMKKQIENFILIIYKAVIPKFISEKITMYRDAGGLNTLRKNILKYYSDLPVKSISEEQREILDYLKKHPVKIFPYAFTKKYRSNKIQVYTDEKMQLHYVLHNQKKLFFKRGWTKNDIRNNYKDLLIEQDKQSPHKYLSNEFQININSIIVDVGSAEGSFALDAIDKISKIYLFETDLQWIEALQATFAPWAHKVHIINKFVSGQNDDNNITLDKYFENDEQIDFIKIDVDGAEMELLKGADKILNKKNSLKIAICTYHNQDDEEAFTKILKDTNFKVRPSNGYMIYYYHTEFNPPFLRRGLIRAEK